MMLVASHIHCIDIEYCLLIFVCSSLVIVVNLFHQNVSAITLFNCTSLGMAEAEKAIELDKNNSNGHKW